MEFEKNDGGELKRSFSIEITVRHDCSGLRGSRRKTFYLWQDLENELLRSSATC